MEVKGYHRGVWVFADYRDYFKNRVTLELIAEGKRLSRKINSDLSVIVFGQDTHRYIMEYSAHGADRVIVVEDPRLGIYRSDIYSRLLSHLITEYRPEIVLIGATDFGRELAPLVAKRLRTGLTSDCIRLEIDEESGLLVQGSPVFSGTLLAWVATPFRRPQMATVRPGQFKEEPHNPEARAEIIFNPIDIGILPEKIKVRGIEKERMDHTGIEDARVVVCGGKGIGTREGLDSLRRLAEILRGEVGVTRPIVMDGMAGEERLIGQTGKKIRPRLLITCGTSGALQYTAGIENAEFIVAINRDPDAAIFRTADIGIVGDANRIVQQLIDALEKRRRSKGPSLKTAQSF